MQQESQFSIQLRKYLAMAMKIWPSLRVGLRHISDITGASEQSLLPRHQYNTMTSEHFIETLTNDMHQFIMQHDVKEQDIEDYLNDILDLLSIDEDLSSSNKMGSVRYMSREVIKVICQLQQGKTESVQKFEYNIFNPVMQMGVGDAIQQGGQDSDDDEEMDDEDDDGSESEGQEWEQDEMEQGEQKKPKEQKDQQELKKQQQLEDDGWVIVKKK